MIGKWAGRMGKKEQISEYLRNEILQGRLKAGDRVYSRFEIMSRFSCTRATADKAVSDLVKGGVLSTIKGGGTFVKSHEAGPAVKSIAVVGPAHTRPSMPQEIFQGLMQALGSEQPIRFFNYDELRQARVWQSCKAHRGIAFIMPDVQHSLFIMEARAEKVPHLAVYRDPPESSFVSVDNYGGTAALIKALAAKGCRRIAFLTRRESRYYFPEQRYAGFLEALLAAGLPLYKELVRLAPRGTEEAACREIMEAGPDAVVVMNLAFGPLIQAGEVLGKKAGLDFQVASFDYVPEGTYPFPIISLESVTEQAGQEAARVLRELLREPGKLVQKYITPTVK